MTLMQIMQFIGGISIGYGYIITEGGQDSAFQAFSLSFCISYVNVVLVGLFLTSQYMFCEFAYSTYFAKKTKVVKKAKVVKEE